MSVVVPALNESRALGATLLALQRMAPAPREIIVVDGGSEDETRRVAAKHGVRCIRGRRGRAKQMNDGARKASGDLLWFVHADTLVPACGVECIRATMACSDTVLGGFYPRIFSGSDTRRTLWFMSVNNWAKTFYGPLLLRPLSFARGMRCLFGDQAMFCRRSDFWRCGGFSEELPLMEDADLCVRMHMVGPGPNITRSGGGDAVGSPSERPRRGRIRMVPRAVHTSGRRIEAMGCPFRATYIHARIGLSWWFTPAADRPDRLQRLKACLYRDDPSCAR